MGVEGMYGSDQSDFDPGLNPSRSILTPSASRADRTALALRPCSRAIFMTCAAGNGPPAKASVINSIASALAVLPSAPLASAASAWLAVMLTGWDSTTPGSDNVVGANEGLFQPEREALRWRCQVVLGMQEQVATALALRVLNDSEGGAWCTSERDRADEAVERLRSITGTGLAEMGDSQNCNARAVCHVAERLQHAAHFAVLVAVGLPQIGRDRIDNDQGNIADFGDFLLEQYHIGLQIKGAAVLAVGAANCGRSRHAPGRRRSHQPRDNGVGGAVFSLQDNDIADDRRATFTAWSFAASRNRGDNSNANLALAGSGFSRDTGMLAARDATIP